MKKYLISLALCAIVVLNLSGISRAAEKKVTAPASPAKVEATKAPAAAPGSVLAMEKTALAASGAVAKDLNVKKFRKRLPQNYKTLKLTEEQEKKVYAVQEDYFSVMATLEARLLRLRQERDAAISAVLTAEQKDQLAKLQPPKAPKAPKKASAKKAGK